MYYFFILAECSCFAFALFSLFKKISIFKCDFKFLFLLLFLSGCFAISNFLGGSSSYSWLAGIKFFIFCTILIFSIVLVETARLVLFVFLFLELAGYFISGDIFTKYGIVHFLLFGCLMSISMKKEVLAKKIVFLTLGMEFLQAIVLSSRTGLLFCAFSVMIMLLPGRYMRSLVRWGAFTLPLLYVMAMYFVQQLITAESSWISASASNFERSLMVAWAVDNFPKFILYGPREQFSEVINMAIENRWLHATYIIDPHNFLLSVWVWLGGVLMLLGYFLWCRLFDFSKYKVNYFQDIFMKSYAILAFFSMIIFITAPPNSAGRLKMALVLGVAIAGLRYPKVLMCMKAGRSSVPKFQNLA